jgi:hypothetical protein
MAKKAPNTFFQNYRRIEAPTISARQMDGPFVLPNGSFKAGDYIVQLSDGTLEGRAKDTFEAEFELVKATWSRKKKAEGEANTEAQPEGSAQQEAAA